MIKALTFDLWDTLVYPRNYGEFRLPALRRLLMENGVFLDDEKLNTVYQSGWSYSKHVIRTQGQRHVETGEIVDTVLKNAGLHKPPNRGAVIRMYEEAVLMDPPGLKEGAIEALEAVKGRYKLGLVSVTGVSPGRLMRDIMEDHGILHYFETLAFSDEVGYVKPNARLFTAALDELGAKPADSVHIGDSVKSDVVGARNTGMRVVWVKSREQRMVAEPDVTIGSLRQLPEALKALEKTD